MKRFSVFRTKDDGRSGEFIKEFAAHCEQLVTQQPHSLFGYDNRELLRQEICSYPHFDLLRDLLSAETIFNEYVTALKELPSWHAEPSQWAAVVEATRALTANAANPTEEEPKPEEEEADEVSNDEAEDDEDSLGVGVKTFKKLESFKASFTYMNEIKEYAGKQAQKHQKLKILFERASESKEKAKGFLETLKWHVRHLAQLAGIQGALVVLSALMKKSKPIEIAVKVLGMGLYALLFLLVYTFSVKRIFGNPTRIVRFVFDWLDVEVPDQTETILE